MALITLARSSCTSAPTHRPFTFRARTTGISFSTTSISRILPSAWRSAEKAFLGVKRLLQASRPLSSATSFIMEQSQRHSRISSPFSGHSDGQGLAPSNMRLTSILRQCAPVCQLVLDLKSVSETLGREINPHVLTREEFAQRQRANDHFYGVTVSRTPNTVKSAGFEVRMRRAPAVCRTAARCVSSLPDDRPRQAGQQYCNPSRSLLPK